jgi:uncharacterized protein (TIGR00369 family)
VNLGSVEQRRDALRQSMVRTPYVQALGLQFEKFGPDGVSMRLPFAKWLTNDGVHFHGGVISAVLDTAGAGAFWASHDFSAPLRASTIGLNVQFTGACKGTDLWCTARVVRSGKILVFTEATGRDPDGLVVAHSTQTFRLVARIPTGAPASENSSTDDGSTP